MKKSFYYSVPWSELNYLRETLASREIPFTLEQIACLQLTDGEVAVVFPDLHVRVYRHVRELFGGDGRAYPW